MSYEVFDISFYINFNNKNIKNLSKKLNIVSQELSIDFSIFTQ
jgi:hypothetical protein